MKKRTIWTIAIVMGISFAVLISLQIYYFTKIVDMRQKQFDENVKRALYQAARAVELNETKATIEAEIAANARRYETTLHAERQSAGPPVRTAQHWQKSMDSLPPALRLDVRLGAQPTAPTISEKVRQRFLHQKDLLNEVIYSSLYRPLDKPLQERINRNSLDAALKTELQHNGIDLRKIHYHFQVFGIDGREVTRCQDFEESFDDAVYKQELFPNDPSSQTGFIMLRFPDVGNYIYESARFVLPAIVFTFVLLGVFVFTIYTIFRQKRLSEIKNDFINNLTHEFKTPISSISLAAQMLSDKSVTKNEQMFAHLSSVIVDETKRLRFQVEKVLQMAMFDRDDAATFKYQEADANSIIEEVVQTFRLKVESAGGSISIHTEAEDPIVYIDTMHFTNLIYNLLDNALKYRRPDTPAQLSVSTSNSSGRLVLRVSDNGIGIKKEDQRRIFDRFYRVSTGNRHDVKGVGIGLAYVWSVVKAHKGTIAVESTYGEGTTFTISIPLIES
ncbi:MAG: HAMP domain-containing sensor histidine kinase [Bacteroidales bacterium]|nr:HAMP domain-containing sensor histidine kinase [Bacteroidales bacterium]